MIGKVGKLVDGFLFVAGFGGDDDLGALLANLFEDFINTLFEKIGGVGALGLVLFAAFEKFIKPAEAELGQAVALIDFAGKAGLAAGVAGRAVLFHRNKKGVAVAVLVIIRDNVLIISSWSRP